MLTAFRFPFILLSSAFFVRATRMAWRRKVAAKFMIWMAFQKGFELLQPRIDCLLAHRTAK